jgi:hypothetical protein
LHCRHHRQFSLMCKKKGFRGHLFLPTRPNSSVYQDFLQNILLELLRDMNLQTKIHLLFLHDGVPALFSSSKLRILEKYIPGTIERISWINMACLFPWFKSVRFLSLGCL